MTIGIQLVVYSGMYAYQNMLSESVLILLRQAFMRKAWNRTHMPWHTPATSKVCKISHVLIALKLQVSVASCVGFYHLIRCSLFTFSATF